MPALIKFVERIMVESISFKTLSRFSFFIFHYFKHIYILLAFLTETQNVDAHPERVSFKLFEFSI